jgi:HAD superfamily hydrolase (TIGR01509 family)
MSLGYIPPVPRLRLPARRASDWVLSTRADRVANETGTPRRGGRGLILDLDDTLYPRERFVMSGFAAVARHVEEVYGVAAELAYGMLLRAHRSALHGQEFEALCDRFRISRAASPALLDVFRRHVPAIQLSHEVADTLHALRAAGWRLVVLTNGLPSVQFRKVAALGLSSLVDDVVYAEEHVAGGTPAAAAFRAALAALDLAPEQCVCVGDDLLRDVRGARALGIRTIRMARPGVTAAPGEEADVVLDRFAMVPEAARLLLDVVTAGVA